VESFIFSRSHRVRGTLLWYHHRASQAQLSIHNAVSARLGPAIRGQGEASEIQDMGENLDTGLGSVSYDGIGLEICFTGTCGYQKLLERHERTCTSILRRHPVIETLF
jgi:hypothetical protein